MSHWSADAGSLAIVGRTQTGKTTLARELHARSDRFSVWLNERGDDRVPNVAGETVRTIEGLEGAARRNCWSVNWLSDDRVADIRKLQKWAWQVAERTKWDFRMQIVVDEIHRVAPQSGERRLPGRDEIRRIAKEGMKRNIKLVSITQDPVAMDKQTLRQREYLAAFGLAKEQANYLSDYGVEVTTIRQQLEFAGVVWHADGSLIETGVKAAERYA